MHRPGLEYALPPIALCLLLACSSAATGGGGSPRGEVKQPEAAAAPAEPGPLAITGGRLKLADGSLAPRTLHLAGGKIRAIDEAPAQEGERAIDVAGATLLPAFIDSHVHITFSTPEAELVGGVAAAIDMGAPPSIWREAPKMAPFRLYPSGQLLTAPGGYPTQGWGADGYGREIRGVDDAKAAAAEVISKGAKVVKMPLAPEFPLLAPEERLAIVAAAHAAGLPVGAHVMTAEMGRLALSDGVDILVHSPAERLDDETIRAFCSRKGAAVIPTLEAFAVSGGAVSNVKRMKAAGCAVLYGTDLGNGVSAGILTAELVDYVKEVGMTPAEAIDSATRAPAAYFGLSDLGELAVGKAASLIAVDGDPYADIAALDARRLVVIEGRVIQVNN